MQPVCFLKTLLTSVSDCLVHRFRKNWSDEWDYWLDVMLVVTYGICVGGVQTLDYVCSDVVQGWVHYCGVMTVYTFVHMEEGGSVCWSVWEVSWYHWYYHIYVCSWVCAVQRLNAGRCLLYTLWFLGSWFEVATSLSHISFLAGITCDFVYATFLWSGIWICVVGLMSWCSVVVVLNAMPVLVFFNRLVIFLILGLW
jgi:hypothetical protein